MKLLTGSLLLLLLAACGGETGGNGETGGKGGNGETGGNGGETGGKGGTGETVGKGNEQPKFYRCNAQPTPERCTGITNSFLTQDKLAAGLGNYLIRNNYAYDRGTQANFGLGQNINKVSYGTIAGIGTKYNKETFKNDFTFKEAIDADKKDDDKNNIIKILTGRVGGSASENYYYSHIKGKQFTQFLPAINKLEILALNSDLATKAETTNIIFLSDVFIENSPTIYKSLKDFVVKAKDYTFKGFALVRFSNKFKKTDSIKEDDLYPGKFTLTFNSEFDQFINTKDNYFSMKIELYQEAEAQTTPNHTDNVAAKPAVKTIEIKEFDFRKHEKSPGKFRSYASDESPATDWEYIPSSFSFLAFSEKQDKIEQIAGLLLLYKYFVKNVNTNTPAHTQYIRIAFASNEVCDSDTDKAGTTACPRVQLTE